MPVTISCPRCRNAIKAPASGGTARCPRCQRRVSLPVAHVTPARPAPRTAPVARVAPSPVKAYLLIAAVALGLGVFVGMGLVISIGVWVWWQSGQGQPVASAPVVPEPPAPVPTPPAPPQPEMPPEQEKAPPPMPEKPPEQGVQLSEAEQQLLDLINQTRAGENLPALKPNAKLFEVARAHAANMAKQEKLDENLDDKDTPARLGEAGYKHRKVIANMIVDANLDVGGAVGQWLEGVVPRANILDRYEETGIGIARNDKGDVYYFQVFAIPER